jgi:hypothetical protein
MLVYTQLLLRLTAESVRKQACVKAAKKRSARFTLLKPSVAETNPVLRELEFTIV